MDFCFGLLIYDRYLTFFYFMELYPFLFDILKFTISGVGVVWIAIYLIKPYIDRNERIQMLEFRKSISNQTLSLRLQAFERLVLFIERINPGNLLLRLNVNDFTAAELHTLMLEEIRNEFQHNITQQIYVTTKVWVVVKQVKEQTLSLVNGTLRELPENATGLDLAKTILMRISQTEENPYDLATNMIRTDFEDLF